jgi:hypothetical protein
MKRSMLIALTAIASLTLAACGADDNDGQRNNNQQVCPPSGVACVAECPASGTLAGGAPCQRGSWDTTGCSCDPLPAPTCAEAGGSCGPLTATGVLCDAGYVLDEKAGSCGVGASCCVPDPTQQTCPPTGVACSLDCPAKGKLPGGVPCQYGAWDQSSCTCAKPTCAAAGGSCGALTANGVSCDTGYSPVAEAGTCAPGGSCCMPAR